MKAKKKHRTSYVVNGCLAAAVLYFALHLSSSGRTAVDFVVIALVLGAIGWNVFKLSQRLYRSHGNKEVWHVLRTVLFWIIGLGNTVFVKAGDAGTWRHWLGWVMLGLAAADTIALYFKERVIANDPSLADDGTGFPREGADTEG